MNIKLFLGTVFFFATSLLISSCDQGEKRKTEAEIESACTELAMTSQMQASKKMDILKSYNFSPQQAKEYIEYSKFYINASLSVSRMADNAKEMGYIPDSVKKVFAAYEALPECKEYLTEIDKGDDSFKSFKNKTYEDFEHTLKAD